MNNVVDKVKEVVSDLAAKVGGPTEEESAVQLDDKVQKLLTEAAAAKQKAKEADKEYAKALKELNNAQRAEKKAKDATLAAHKDAVSATHAVVEFLLKQEKDVSMPAVDVGVMPPSGLA